MTLLSMALLASAAPVKIAAVTAKSTYATGEVSYPADNVRDGKASTPWFEGDSGSGVGTWIEVDLGAPRTVTRIQLLAGDWSSGTGWTRANRPREIEVRWSDETTALWTLRDEYKMQTFVPTSPKSTTKIRFKVNALFSGTAFPDMAISEILVFDDSADTTATIASVTASSEFPQDAEGGYFAAQAADGVRDTFWCEGNKTSDGTGEWLAFTFDAPTLITAVSLCNGMCSTADVLKKGNAPARATLTFSDGSSQAVDLKAVMPLPQKLAITPVTTSSVKLVFDAIRKGTDFDDACVSEVTFLE